MPVCHPWPEKPQLDGLSSLAREAAIGQLRLLWPGSHWFWATWTPGSGIRHPKQESDKAKTRTLIQTQIERMRMGKTENHEDEGEDIADDGPPNQTPQVNVVAGGHGGAAAKPPQTAFKITDYALEKVPFLKSFPYLETNDMKSNTPWNVKYGKQAFTKPDLLSNTETDKQKRYGDARMVRKPVNSSPQAYCFNLSSQMQLKVSF